MIRVVVVVVIIMIDVVVAIHVDTQYSPCLLISIIIGINVAIDIELPCDAGIIIFKIPHLDQYLPCTRYLYICLCQIDSLYVLFSSGLVLPQHSTLSNLVGQKSEVIHIWKIWKP